MPRRPAGAGDALRGVAGRRARRGGAAGRAALAREGRSRSREGGVPRRAGRAAPERVAARRRARRGPARVLPARRALPPRGSRGCGARNGRGRVRAQGLRRALLHHDAGRRRAPARGAGRRQGRQPAADGRGTPPDDRTSGPRRVWDQAGAGRVDRVRRRERRARRGGGREATGCGGAADPEPAPQRRRRTETARPRGRLGRADRAARGHGGVRRRAGRGTAPAVARRARVPAPGRCELESAAAGRSAPCLVG